MNLLRVHHIAIICSNYTVSKEFYVDKLGLKIIAENFRKERNSYKLDLLVGNNYQIELFSFIDPPVRVNNPESAGMRHLCFAVEDIGKSIYDLKQKGIICEPVKIDPYTQKKYTFFRDPDDLPLELYEDN